MKKRADEATVSPPALGGDAIVFHTVHHSYLVLLQGMDAYAAQPWGMHAWVFYVHIYVYIKKNTHMSACTQSRMHMNVRARLHGVDVVYY